ncbi:hypothetical protein [Terrihalobacillus insolitus]|uniref:hypothetical protein n=1 Tax=Terrihalobacillus insolitus TaxID=2950438 RepID=UPI002342823B|nr:hypothetical protein [Terrihalobacillus insolitus]MDC3412935.1 hypothetical protein [Terrihalobacillus insolitus]
MGKLYFVDLSGAGLGAITSIWLMNILDPFRAIIVISLLIIVTHMPIFYNRKQKLTILISITLILVLGINLFQPVWTTERFKVYKTSPYTTFSEENADIIYTDWDAMSRTDVYNAEDKDFLYITIDGGAVSSISKFDGNFNDVKYLKQHTSFLAFSGEEKERAQLIGVGGGQDILSSKMAGFKHVEAVDINRNSFKAIENLSSLGHPTLSFAIVLGVLLPVGGMGSYCYYRWDKYKNQKFYPYIWIFIITCFSKIS